MKVKKKQTYLWKSSTALFGKQKRKCILHIITALLSTFLGWASIRLGPLKLMIKNE